ncbi:neurotrimin-like [Ptychodera flava]|uniref:neurotrimin-like n=1 Tax=Ptychodera flava TaxID=63121 RepID=UPI003969D05C
MIAGRNLALYVTVFLKMEFSNAKTFIVKPVDTLVRLGDSTQLNCTFSSASARKAWYMRTALTASRRIRPNSNRHYEIVTEGSVYNLRLHKVTSSEQAKYLCALSSDLTEGAVASIYVISSVPVCSVDLSYIPTEGDNVTLTCSIDLNQYAPGELVWFRNGIEIHRKKGRQSTVTIQLDKSDHGATYDCGLQHFTLPSWKWSNLTCLEKIVMEVKYTAGYIKANKTTFEVPVGDVMNLNCTADGFPTPNISWFDSDGDVIPGNEVNQNIKIHNHDETRVTSRLNITIVDESYHGIYRCEAFNGITSSVNQTFKIVKQGTAGPKNQLSSAIEGEGVEEREISQLRRMEYSRDSRFIPTFW